MNKKIEKELKDLGFELDKRFSLPVYKLRLPFLSKGYEAATFDVYCQDLDGKTCLVDNGAILNNYGGSADIKKVKIKGIKKFLNIEFETDQNMIFRALGKDELPVELDRFIRDLLNIELCFRQLEAE